MLHYGDVMTPQICDNSTVFFNGVLKLTTENTRVLYGAFFVRDIHRLAVIWRVLPYYDAIVCCIINSFSASYALQYFRGLINAQHHTNHTTGPKYHATKLCRRYIDRYDRQTKSTFNNVIETNCSMFYYIWLCFNLCSSSQEICKGFAVCCVFLATHWVRPRQNGNHFADDTVIYLNENIFENFDYNFNEVCFSGSN